MIELVGEIGLNHNGDIEIAKKLIDVCHVAGVHYVKFQKRDIESCYTKEFLDSPRESPWGTRQRHQKMGLEFDEKEYDEIDKYCYRVGMQWFASAWDLISLDFIMQYNIPFIKIPSALITDFDFLERTRKYDQQVILSTGMSTQDMIDDAIEILGIEKIYCIMQCTSTYPSASKEQNLQCIANFKVKYPWTKIGFSNHSPGLTYMTVAAGLGAEVIEFHITLDRAMYGSDQAASIEPEGVLKIAKYVRKIQDAMGDGIKKIYPSEEPIIKKLRK